MNIGLGNPLRINPCTSILYCQKEDGPLFHSPHPCPRPALSGRKTNHLTIFYKRKNRALDAIAGHIKSDSV